MNNKHIASLVILFLCVVIIQGVLMVRKRATAMQASAEKARLEVDLANTTLRGQRIQLDNLTNTSANLLKYLDAWEPYLFQLSTPETGELYVNTLIKKNSLLLLAQRFDVIPNKAESGGPKAPPPIIPQIVRANLTIEDDFTKSINWLGELEKTLPAARISNLELVRGQSGNDIRMNLIIDVPLAKNLSTESTAPK